MTAETSTCRNCGKVGHLVRNCRQKRNEAHNSTGGGAYDKKPKTKKYFGGKAGSTAGSKGASGQKWCSVHKTTSHSDEGCYAQGAQRPEHKGAHLATAVLSAGSPPVNDDENPSLNFDDDFDKGFAFSGLTTRNDGGITVSNPDVFTMLVDSGASDHFVDSELIRGLQQGMVEYRKLEQPKPIETAGNKQVFATATGKICGHIINKSGPPIPVRIFVMIVPGMGRHLFSSARAMKSGVSTILETGNPHLQFDNKTSLLLNQHQKDAGMCSFDVSLRALDGVTYGRSEKPSTPSVALPAQVSADTWHRRLGHMNPCNMELLRKVEGNGVEYTGTVSGCDICAVGKSTQKAHPKKDKHTTDGPMELVYTDLMGPITPAARGGYKYVSKFTDGFSRMKEIFLLKSKAEAVNSLHLYNMTVAVPLGLRIQRLRCDKGGEYTSKEFKQLCINSGITMEYTATATPQQNGVSERDGRTLATMTRCLLKDGNFPRNMWGELFFTAVHLCNRAPHSALGGATPFLKMHGKEADLSGLRAIGSRAFVHIETHTTKLGDKAWEGKLCGFSQDSRAYRIYNPAKGTVVESRNVTFLETPPYSMPPVGTDYSVDDEDYENDVIDLTSFLDFTILDSPEKELEHLRTKIRGMLQENANKSIQPQEAASLQHEASSLPEELSPSPEEPAPSPEEGTSQEAGASSGVVPAASTGEPAAQQPRVTRASTRSNPNTDDTFDSSLTPNQLLYLAKGEPRIKTMGMREDFAHIEGDPFLSYKAFTYATSNPDDKRFSEEVKRVLQTPRTHNDAINSPEHKEWKAAIDKEMNSLKEHQVYELVPITSVPKDNKIIGSRFVFKQKTDGRFKARLVVQGYVQEPGIDYGKSYAPVCRVGSIRMLLAIACEHGWPVWQLDVQVAFLQSKIEGRAVYVKVAPGQDAKDPKTGEPMVYKLKRSLYGLAQSPVLWYDTINAEMLTVGFTPTQSDPCVYTHGSGDTLVILTLYVDDILITGKDESVVRHLKKALTDRFAMSDMGEVSLILGMTVTRDYDQGTLSITQKDYVENILERFGMEECNPVHTPGYGSELSNEQPEETLLGATATKLYQAIVGSVLYLTQCTRYDMCYSVNQLTRACSKPAQAHMTAAKHALRYLKGHPDLPITFKKGQFRLHGFTDASFGANPDTRKSTTGSIFFLSGGPISFGSKTQSIVALSTVESELNALSYGAKEAVYLSNFLKELTFKNFNSVPISCDSTGALTVAGNSTYTARTKHIALRFFFIRELVKEGRITLHYVPTGKMLADCATKHLAKIQFKNILLQIKEFSG